MTKLATAAETETITVASVPAGHPYVANLGLAEEVKRLPDPQGPDGRWWPPKMLKPEWVDSHRSDFDLFHVHFGFDGEHPGSLFELCETLRLHGRPLVYTVHDLENPHHADQSLHRRQMEVLMEAASAVVTLTGRAREKIAREFGRDATVIPHPHIFPLDELPVHRDRVPGRSLTVGLHYKSLRRNMIGLPMLDGLAAVVDRFLPSEVILRVDVHQDVWTAPASPGARGLVRRLAELDRAGRIDLRVHDYFDEREFMEYIGGIDISVLPYAFGTHSGWMEACRDLGTAVVAPDCGCYSDQGTVFEYRVNGGRPEKASIAAALRRAVRAVNSFDIEPLGPRFRRAQRQRIGQAHLDLYRSVLGRERHPAGRSSPL